jgi:hypothetical protein
MKVGRYLVGEGKKIRLGVTAQSLDVDVRTLWNWKKEAKEGLLPKKIGRPVYTFLDHTQAIWKVGRELRRQGYPGWRGVSSALQGEIPDRLIQHYVRGFKKKRAERKRARLLRHRVKVEVLARDVIWGQDGTHVGRAQGKAVESQVLRDRGSLSVVGIQTGWTATHEDVLDLLKSTAEIRHGYPLVLARDNGSIYGHEAVLSHLHAYEVVVLRSLPRTPEHNGATERAIGELKYTAELGKGCHATIEIARAKMQKASTTLNKNRLRPSKELKTADQLDETLPSATDVDRSRFYNRCRENMKQAVSAGTTIRAGRLAEREAIFRTLEEFGLIKRTRGGKPYAPKSEIIL